jgi:hypothetical protein
MDKIRALIIDDSSVMRKTVERSLRQAARATEIIRLLIVRDGLAPDQLSAAGYAEFHPIATNATVTGRGMNRRVDIVILGREPPAVPAASGEPRSIPAGPGQPVATKPNPGSVGAAALQH